MAEASPAVGQLDARVAALIKDKEAEAAKSPQKVHSFNRILLKFPFIAKTLRKIRTIFNEFDVVRDLLCSLPLCTLMVPFCDSGLQWHNRVRRTY
jgi:hypothetical protein